MEKREKQQQYWFVIQQLTSRELKRKYARSVLGVLWSVLNPLLSMGVLSLIFSQMFRRAIENYPIYYLTGYLLWQAFTGTTNSAMTTLADNRTLLLKVKFPMELFVLTRGCTALVNLGYSFVAYGVMLLVFRVEVGWAALFLVPIVGCLFLFSLGIAYALSAAYVFFGDVRHLYSVALTLWTVSYTHLGDGRSVEDRSNQRTRSHRGRVFALGKVRWGRCPLLFGTSALTFPLLGGIIGI